MAVQLCEKRMHLERKHAIQGSSGLHGTAPGKRGRKQLCWDDISSKQEFVTSSYGPMRQLHDPVQVLRDEGGLFLVVRAGADDDGVRAVEVDIAGTTRGKRGTRLEVLPHATCEVGVHVRAGLVFGAWRG